MIGGCEESKSRASRGRRGASSMEAMMNKLLLLGVTAVGSAPFPGAAIAQTSPPEALLKKGGGSTVELSGELATAHLDCRTQGGKRLRIKGIVHVAAPGGTVGPVKIDCPNIIFDAGAQIESKHAISLHASNKISGPVQVSTSAAAGSAAIVIPALWEPRDAQAALTDAMEVTAATHTPASSGRT